MIKAFIILSLIFLVACSSIDLPTKEESKSNIDTYQNELKLLNLEVANLAKGLVRKNDFQLNVKMEAMNQLISKIADSRPDDINIYINPSKSIISEEKSALGIKYTNYVNIDTGYVSLNIKKLSFNKLDKNQIFATLELEGRGDVSVSGKYTGIPAKVKSSITINLAEQIKFDILTDNNANLILKPQAKKMNLNLKFGIKLLEWSVPYNHTVELELADLIKPIKMPLSISSIVELPVANDKVGTNSKIKMQLFELNLSKSELKTLNNLLEYNTSINLKKSNK